MIIPEQFRLGRRTRGGADGEGQRSIRFRGTYTAYGSSGRLELRVDVFNVMNVNTVKQRVVRSGPDFMRPFTGAAAAANVIILPRIVQLGASFSF